MCVKTEAAAEAAAGKKADGPRNKRDFWVVDNEGYDFTEFIDKHPGGPAWFKPSVGRDISVLYHGYHKDPTKLQGILKKYKITKEDPDYEFCQFDNIFPKLGLPPFATPPGFDARRDVVKWDFQKKNSLLKAVQNVVKTPEFQKKVSRANLQFDTACILTCAVYLINNLAFLFDIQVLPFEITTWASVVIYVICRAFLGAFGHFYLHAKTPHMGFVLFDAGYGPTCVTAQDGHVMVHHVHTHSDADAKNILFSGMWALPPLWRPIGFTLNKLGMFISGTFFQLREITARTRKFDKLVTKWYYVAFRLMLASEFWLSLYAGKIVPFMVQFFVILWYLTFVILSGHDFLQDEENESLQNETDWGAYQVKCAVDFRMTGFKYLDMLLSAGLSSHRAHHILPYQPSGFANIITEPVLEKICPDFGVEWVPAKNWFVDLMPKAFKYCFMTPTTGMEDAPFWSQHISPKAAVVMKEMVMKGFFGNAL